METLIENVTNGNEAAILAGPSQFVTDESEDVRPRCPGCDRPLLWITNPRCECGCLLYFPIPTSERI